MRTILMATCLSLASLPAAGGEFDTEGGFAAFENLFGVTEGKRRNHTKGFCVEGELTPVDEAIKAYSTSPLFTGTSDVIARVSHKGGKANPADDKYGLLGLSMEISTHDDDLHVIGMNTEHFFPVSTSEAFIELLRAKATGGDAVKEFAAAHPELKAYKAYHGALDKTLRPYEGTTYNSVNAFYLVNEAGEKTAMRFSFRPSGDEAIVVDTHPDFFLDNMQANIAQGTVSWDMVVTLANPGDPVADPSAQWTGDHTEIVAARFTANAAMSEEDGQCDAINFDPTVLSNGFEPSEDPMLQVRSMIYAHGVGKRLSEKE
ncbi:catalase [Roseovarius aestuarii]|uniref:catalase n=1 Tax=Roseovarius aestuarii TaxID=475083 RepID=A0A1X7BT22_9RHOB|nr:catalase [Roseovarius aestuarii]SMC12791.1 Catalase-related peroxidase precursor [Roseovarius aestuarii]